jgi:hypothetical protein
VLTFTFVGKLDVVVGFMLCGCASVFTLLQYWYYNKLKQATKERAFHSAF